MRHCLMLDLKDDAALIAEYKAQHRTIWPEVAAHQRSHGVLNMDIYRLGTRLCMLMETDDAVFDAECMARAVAADSRLQAWEQLMWRYQTPTPWTQADIKWTAAECIFELRLQL